MNRHTLCSNLTNGGLMGCKGMCRALATMVFESSSQPLRRSLDR